VKDNFSLIIISIIVITLLPAGLEFLKAYREKKG
jgi:hypothetical protein